MKTPKILLISLILFNCIYEAYSQNYIKVENDSIGIIDEPLILRLSKHRGDINWEVSFDSLQWYELDQHSDSLIIWAFCNGVYRAAVAENTCNLVFSDKAYLFVENKPVPKLTINLDSASLKHFKLEDSSETIINYKLNNTIDFSITIPEKRYFIHEFDTLTLFEVKKIEDYPTQLNNLYALHLLPAGMQFQKPVKIMIDLPSDFDTDSVFAFNYFTNENQFYPLSSALTKKTGSERYTLRLAVFHFSGVGVGSGAVSPAYYNLLRTDDEYESFIASAISFFGETSDELLAILKPVYLQWYHKFVIPKINACTDIESLNLAMVTYYRWVTNYFNGFFESEFSELEDMAFKLVGEKVLELIKPLNNSCSEEKDICLKKEYLDAYYELYSMLIKWGIEDEIKDFPGEDEFCNNIVDEIVYTISRNASTVLVKKDEEIKPDLKCLNIGNFVIEAPQLQWEIMDNTLLEMVSDGIFRGLKTGETEITASFCDISETIKVKIIDLPTVHTNVASDIGCYSATANGLVESDGNEAVTERGIYVNGLMLQAGSGTGNFSINISDLQQNTAYTYQAYATNSAGTAYGDQMSFTTAECDPENDSTGTFFDARDGKEYGWVRIGEQVWMAENLDFIAGTGSRAGAYGVLYNWPTAMAGSASSSAVPSGVQGVCPTGWHLPSNEEWTQLIDYLGGEDVAGGKLKESGTSHWNSPNTGATNESGFTALPGGLPFNFGTEPYGIGLCGHWWSATELIVNYAWYRTLSHDYSVISKGWEGMAWGLSVRCVRD